MAERHFSSSSIQGQGYLTVLAFLVLPVKYYISKVVYFAFIRNVAPLVVSRASLELCE